MTRSNAKKILITSCSWTFVVLILKFFLFMEIMKFGIRDQVSLRNKNELRDIYLKIPFPLNFSVYLFNVTNPVDVQNGAKPILKEVGPYRYDEYIEKLDVVDIDPEDSLTYSPYSAFHFSKNSSGDLQEDDYVTILNPLVVGMVNIVAKDSPALLSIVNKAITEIFNDPKSIYMTVRVKDILFDGVEIDCRAKEFAAKAVCSQIKSQMPGLKSRAEKMYLFSILGPRNATLGKRTKVLRGVSNSRDVGRLMEIDGEKELTIWGTPECNRFRGTDGWIFPPLTEGDQNLNIFSGDLCRNVEALYVNSTEMYGIPINRYETEIGDMENNEKDRCYCDTPDTCLKKGLMDLTKCMGVPIIASFPHFYNAHETYLTQVDGMKPDRENHSIYLLFEPMLGIPLIGKKRMQFNMHIATNTKISMMGNLPTALHPIFWIEESIVLEGPLLSKVKNIFLLMKVVEIVLWIALFIGFGVLLFGLYLWYRNRKDFKVTPVHTSNNNKEENITPYSTVGGAKTKKSYVNHAMSGHEFERY